MRLPGGGSGGSTDPNDIFALAFTGVSHVNHGGFWVADQILGNSMLWEAWLTSDPTGSQGYHVSDGWGGGHAILWGPLGGNIWSDTAGEGGVPGAVSFDVDGEGVPSEQIYHASVGLGTDEQGLAVIVLHINGIPIAYTPMVGTRIARANGTGSNILFIGGSDHSMFVGKLLQLRAYDRVNPLSAGKAMFAYTPERSFIDGGNGAAVDEASYSDFLVDYTVPHRVIPDLSRGYNGGDAAEPRLLHSGAMFNPHGGRLDNYQTGRAKPQTADDLPSWVAVTNHPFGPGTPPTALPLRSLTPPSTPPGAVVFDSFSREDQTFAWTERPELGSTEAGSAGVLPWQFGFISTDAAGTSIDRCWGIFNGAIRYINGAYSRSVAWVDTGIADQDVRVTRKVTVRTHGNVTVAGRVQDKDNFFVGTFNWNDTQTGGLAISKYVAGIFTNLYFSGFNQPKGTWTVLRLVLDGTSISLYTDDTLVQTITDSDLQSATGAGVAMTAGNTGPGSAGGMSLASWDNFTVLAP